MFFFLKKYRATSFTLHMVKKSNNKSRSISNTKHESKCCFVKHYNEVLLLCRNEGTKINQKYFTDII